MEILPWTPLQTPFTPGKCSSSIANPMMLKFGENLLHLPNKNCFKVNTNPTVDLRGIIIWNKTPEALSWKSFHAYFLHTSFPWTTPFHTKELIFSSHIHFLPFPFPQQKIIFYPLINFHDLSLNLFPLSNGNFKIFPSNQWPSHPSRANENWEWFALQLILGWEFLGPMRHKKYSIFQSNRMTIFMTNGIGGLILLFILDILMRFLSLILILSVRWSSHLTSSS
jgi:hypothetical protein